MKKLLLLLLLSLGFVGTSYAHDEIIDRQALEKEIAEYELAKQLALEEAREKEIAEFETELAAELAAQEMMATIDSETIISEYSDNGLPKYYELMDGKTPINIEFTDVIDGRYIVDVEWFPDWGLAPLLTGPANINFMLVNRDVKFSVKADLFHIERQIKAKNITSKEAIKVNSSELTSVPFNFRDMNFDGINELVITNREGGQRFLDSYTIYLIQEIEGSNYFNVLDLSDTMPYSKFDAITKFNSEDKTVWMSYSGGACSSSYELYQRVFSDYPLGNYQFKLIKKVDYDYQDKNGNNIGCHIYTYDIVNGREVLNVAESGPVN